jgi:hypothetical protein
MTAFSFSSNAKYAGIVATGLSGVVLGCLTFVSLVEAPTFLDLLGENKKRSDLVKEYFSVWWPYGKSLMVPLLASSTAAHGLTYTMTKHANWIFAGLLIVAIGPYTHVVLMEDIDHICKPDSTQIVETTKEFCRLHHVRTIMALVGFGLSLFELANM